MKNENAFNNESENESLIICNTGSKQIMKHGKDFKDLLDPRDRILEHDFDFTVEVDLEHIKPSGFLNSEAYQTIKNKIH